MTWHHLTLCCIVLYMDIYVSHNTDQVEALFSALQLNERVRLKTRERDKERGRERIEERRGGGGDQAIPNMNIFPSFTAKEPVALQSLERSRNTGVRGMHC